MSELKPCPFCGCNAKLSEEYEYKVHCSNGDCYCSLNEKAIRDGYDGYICKDDAIAEWNYRSINTKQQEDIAELVKHLKVMTRFYAMDLRDHSVIPDEDPCYISSMKVLAKHNKGE